MKSNFKDVLNTCVTQKIQRKLDGFVSGGKIIHLQFLIGLDSFVEVDIKMDLTVQTDEYNGEGYCFYEIYNLHIVSKKVIGKDVDEDVILEMAEDRITPLLEYMDPVEDGACDF